jgi:SAM-dependent methyltransferase
MGKALATLKQITASIPILGPILKRGYFALQRRAFEDSTSYWLRRYDRGGNSGPGSFGKLAQQKADVINGFVQEHAIRSVIEYGCGDGNQLQLAAYERYIGFDISPTAIARCRALFANDPTKSFRLMDDYAGETVELTLSLDVIFHLVENEVYDQYMQRLFASATRFVIVYSSNTDVQAAQQSPHVRHHRFTDWVAAHAPTWTLIRHIPNQYPATGVLYDGSFADFFIFAKAPVAAPGR